MTDEDLICEEHSGVCSDIKHLDDNVSQLWKKWDSMQKLLISTAVTSVVTLIGVILILVKPHVQ